MRFATPDEAEQAFYDAFNRGCAVAMRDVWLEDDSVVCIHPQCPPVSGHGDVIDSWERILTGPGSLDHQLHSRCQGPLLAVHTGLECLHVGNRQTVLAVTNVFQLTPQGWRMLLHHASAAPAAANAPAVH